MKELSTEERIKSEIKRISKLFETADTHEFAIIQSMIENLAFMSVTLANLQEVVNKTGVIDEYRNGEHQYGVKQSAALQSYNSLLKNYNTVVKTLLTVLPPGERPKVQDKLTEFLKGTDSQKDPAAEERYEAEHRARINAEIEAAKQRQARERAEYELKKLQKQSVY